MIGDCFTLVDRGDRCELVRSAFDVTPSHLAASEPAARALFGEFRLHAEDGASSYHVVDVQNGVLVLRPDMQTSLELWDRRHAALVRARLEVRQAREALENLGLFAPFLTLSADGIAFPGREAIPSVAGMQRLRAHWESVPRQRSR